MESSQNRICVFRFSTPLPRQPNAAPNAADLRFRFRFAQADDFVSGFKLTALLEKFDALKSFQNVALRCDGAEAF